jgi:hypothetical protein
MGHAIETGLGAMMYILSLIKIGSAIQKLIGGIHRHTDGMETAKAYFYCFQNKESRLKNREIKEFHILGYSNVI